MAVIVAINIGTFTCEILECAAFGLAVILFMVLVFWKTEQKLTSQEEKKIIIHAIHEAINRGHSFSLWKSPGVDKKNLIISTTGVKK